MSKSPGGLGSNAPGFGRAFSLGFEFVAGAMLFWLLGRFIDGRLGTEPWGQVVGSVIGWVGGFLHVYYKTKGQVWEEVPGTRRRAPAQSTGKQAAPGRASTSEQTVPVESEVVGAKAVAEAKTGSVVTGENEGETTSDQPEPTAPYYEALIDDARTGGTR